MLYRVYPSDHTYTNEVDLPPYTGLEDYDSAGAYRTIRNYEAPLTDELQNQGALSLSIKLYEITSVHYFDSENIYFCDIDRYNAGVITTTVPRSEAETYVYTGCATIEETTFSAEATISVMSEKSR